MNRLGERFPDQLDLGPDFVSAPQAPEIVEISRRLSANTRALEILEAPPSGIYALAPFEDERALRI